MAKEFDLIPANKLCDMFRVEFELYTPRAYFIILAPYELDDEAKPKVVESTFKSLLFLSDMQSRSQRNQGIIV